MENVEGGNGKLKKIIIFLAIILFFFSAIAFVNGYKTKEALKDNPYKKKDLDNATIQQLQDPNYQNIILPEELKTRLHNGETVTVYFFSPKCSWCNKTTPIVVPLAEELGIELTLFNVLEFEEGWDDYLIEGTPTIIHFQGGTEAARKVGFDNEENFRKWFEEVVLRK